MKALFIGLGSMGHKHVDILKRNHDCEIYAFRSGSGLAPTPEGVTEITTWAGMNGTPDVAFITNPSHLHIKTAIKCAEHGANLFIEKPLDTNTHGLDDLCDLVRGNNLSAYVAIVKKHSQLRKLALIVFNANELINQGVEAAEIME